jgi:E3 ubiquitin-protein ligase BAH
VGRTFTKIIASDPIMSETMAKAVCAQMSTDLSKIVPQVDDYSCPICSEVQWRPVRMKCRHIFCSSCAVKMQKQRRKFCPLCREDVVLQADEGKYISVLCHYLEANVMSERVNLNLPRPGIKHRADLCSR